MAVTALSGRDVWPISTPGVVQRIAAAPEGPLLATVDRDGRSLTSIDTNTRRVTTSVPLPGPARDLAWSPDGRCVYVTVAAGLAVVDTDSGTLGRTVPVAGSPTGLALTDDGYACVTDPDAATLTLVSP